MVGGIDLGGDTTAWDSDCGPCESVGKARLQHCAGSQLALVISAPTVDVALLCEPARVGETQVDGDESETGSYRQQCSAAGLRKDAPSFNHERAKVSGGGAKLADVIHSPAIEGAIRCDPACMSTTDKHAGNVRVNIEATTCGNRDNLLAVQNAHGE